jgi:septal ring factor EnvC (AmiA/AmiB activator)
MILSQLKSQSKRLLGVGLIFLLVNVIQVSSQTAGKQNKKELENKKKKLNEEINEINSLLDETKEHKKSSINELVAINKKISIREELIHEIEAEITLLNREIKQNQKETDKLKQNLEKLKADYARMIYYAQRNKDSYSRLVFIFAAGDFNQAYMRLKYFQQYSQFRKQQAQEIVSAQGQITLKIEELKEKRKEKNDLLGNEEVEKTTLSKEKETQEVVLSELQRKEKELKNELEKKKKETENLQLAIKKLIEAEIKRKMEESAKADAAALAIKKLKAEKSVKNPKKEVETKKEAVIPELSDEAIELSHDFSNNRGKLPWPVTKGFISEEYGEHEHPAIKGFMMVNNGVEITSAQNAPVRAVFDGEVTSIAESPTGGRLVIIRHGEYLSVYVNLGDVTVKRGDKVTVKQNIGSIKYNEDENKSSMNLQIWKGQTKMDPAQWLSKGK